MIESPCLQGTWLEVEIILLMDSGRHHADPRPISRPVSASSRIRMKLGRACGATNWCHQLSLVVYSNGRYLTQIAFYSYSSQYLLLVTWIRITCFKRSALVQQLDYNNVSSCAMENIKMEAILITAFLISAATSELILLSVTKLLQFTALKEKHADAKFQALRDVILFSRIDSSHYIDTRSDFFPAMPSPHLK